MHVARRAAAQRALPVCDADLRDELEPFDPQGFEVQQFRHDAGHDDRPHRAVEERVADRDLEDAIGRGHQGLCER